MADKIILVDTSLLIDYFRKTDKSKSKLSQLVKHDYIFYISVITEFEIFAGTSAGQTGFWEDFLRQVRVLPFDRVAVKIAVNINTILKRTRKQIDLPDLFIAATAISNGLSLATLNIRHFERVDSLQLIK